jgi:hypothetical protein
MQVLIKVFCNIIEICYANRKSQKFYNHMILGMIRTVAPNVLNFYTCYKKQKHGWRE